MPKIRILFWNQSCTANPVVVVIVAFVTHLSNPSVTYLPTYLSPRGSLMVGDVVHDTCTSAASTVQRVRGLRVRPFSITQPCRQPHSVFGGCESSDLMLVFDCGCQSVTPPRWGTPRGKKTSEARTGVQGLRPRWGAGGNLAEGSRGRLDPGGGGVQGGNPAGVSRGLDSGGVQEQNPAGGPGGR